MVPAKRPSPRRPQHEDSQGDSHSKEGSSESEELTEDDGSSATPSEAHEESTINSVVGETEFQATDLQDSQTADDVDERISLTPAAGASAPQESHPQPETNQQGNKLSTDIPYF